MIEYILFKLNLSNYKNLKNQYLFNCPYCKEFKGNLYKENYHYHCYNCNIHKTLLDITDDFSIEIEKGIYDEILNVINNKNLYRINDNLINETLNLGIDKKDFLDFYKLKNIDIRAIRFLKSNLIKNFNNFYYDDFKKHIYLLNNKNDKVTAYLIFNLRNFGKIENISNLSKIYSEMNIDENIEFKHNILSSIFNIYNINLNLPITIFDDLINSLLFTNSIFLTKHYYIFNKLDIRYFFANNNHGIIQKEKMIKENQKVFNWKNFLNFYSIKGKIYDLRSLLKKHKRTFNFSNYFTYE